MRVFCVYMRRSKRRVSDVLSDLDKLLSVLVRTVDIALHDWDELGPPEREQLFLASTEAAALAHRLESALGGLEPGVSPAPMRTMPTVQSHMYLDELLDVDEASTGEPDGEAIDKGVFWELASNLDPMQNANDLPELYARLAQSVAETLGSDACIVSLVDPETGKLRDVAGSTPGAVKLNVVVEEYDIDDFPVTQSVLRQGTNIEISTGDDQADPAERRLLQEYGFSRALMCPLTAGGAVRGTIEVYRVADRPFRDDDAHRIEILCRFAANAYARISARSDIESHYGKTIDALTSALEVRDAETQAHTGRIRETAVALGGAMRLSPDELKAVRLGAMLHDVGKIGVPDSILLKPGPLNESEWEVMKLHPEIGERLLTGIDFLTAAVPAVKHHHERWDGKGYPMGLIGTDIPLAARVVAVCDSFDAMTSARPYRPPVSVDAACEEILDKAGSQFDPDCAAMLVSIVRAVGDEGVSRRIVRYAS